MITKAECIFNHMQSNFNSVLLDTPTC